MECLHDAVMADLAGNKLSSAQREAAMEHVEQCPSCDERLQELLFGEDEATVQAAAGVLETTDDDLGQTLPGRTLGRYLIIEQVGKGALGAVFAAYDPELDRRVAIKVLHRNVSADDAQLRDNLRQEARIMAKLSHPNVVPIFDVGIADERLFIAMELIDGVTLRDWDLPEEGGWKAVRDVYEKAGIGLAAAHEAGLIYRDFKPSNVMLGHDGRVRVLDFGIAEAVFKPMVSPDAIGRDPSVQGPSGGIGTPGYMAPEQYSADTKIDGRADQYAFCVSLYQSLYGNRPFGGRTLDIVRKNTLEQNWSQPLRDPGVPSWLRATIIRGLSLHPEQRWPDMESLLHALVKDRRSRRTQMMALAGVVAATAVLTSAAMLMFRGELEPAERDRIEQLTIDARAAAAKSHYIYPSVAEPNAETAYTLVLELERTEGDAADPADERAADLRTEFGSTLVALGDRYYDQDGGRPFSMDYYAGALTFLPEHEHAASRLRMTPGQLASLEVRARERSFSKLELEAAQSLVALAAPETGVRNVMLAEVRDRVGPLTTDVHVAEILEGWDGPNDAEATRGAGIDDARPPATDAAEPAPAPEPADEPAVEASADGDAADEPAAEPTSPSSTDEGSGSGRRPRATDDGAAQRDPAKSAAVAKEAKAAFSANQLDRAETLYHRALEFDSKNKAALSGLAELYFERGRYRKSLVFAKRAIKRSPSQGNLRILLGDAHFKVLEYGEARRHYDKAQSLGHPSATKRLEKLEKTVGN
ncbi:MAG: protein kinase [Myxococcota bacterium]